MRKKSLVLATPLVAASLAFAGCAPSADGGDSGSSGGTEQVEVGVITAKSGPLAAYGEAYLQGFEAGLDYATEGTGEVNGTEIVVREGDGAADPDKAVQLAKQYIGDGVDILAGTVSSGVALAMAEQAQQNEVLYISGPAASDAITGVNGYTFRSGRQTYQDVATAATFLDDVEGSKVVVFAQDNAFGEGNAAAVEAVLGKAGMGGEVSRILVGEDVREFTSFAQQIIDAEPDLVFVAWAGDSTGSMWQALGQQGVFQAAPVVTGLGDTSTYGAYGPVGEKISFLSHYFAEAPDNEVNAAMVEAVTEAGGQPDLFTPDGFVAAQMIVHAIEEGEGDVDAMVDALEGWEFAGPKGDYTVRAEDHALLQNMYQAKLVEQDGEWAPELISTVPGDEVAPPTAG